MKWKVITSYIPNADVDYDFIRALMYLCEYRDAEFNVMECKSNYLGDMEEPLQMVLEEELKDYLVKGDVRINDNLHMSSFKQSINVIDPLSGMDSIAADKGSFILAFPRHRYKSVARMLKESHYPRAIWCTGTISEPYYKNTKSGIRMKSYHVKGALLVGVENDKIYHVRQIQWDGEGFYDLDMYFTKDGFKVDKNAISAISLGDDHVIFQNKFAMGNTKKHIKRLRPKNIFRHDTLDCASISHHVIGKHLTKAEINMTLEEELIATAKSLKSFEEEFPFAKQYQVFSNHPEHLDRYLDEARYKEDNFNHILGLELAWRKADGDDPYQYAMKKYGNVRKTIFLGKHNTVKIAGYEMACHGHDGNNGSRGNPKQLGLVYNGKVITGHTHSSEISVYGNPVNGTLTDLVLPYTSEAGGSSWTWTNTIVYKNGTITQIHIIPNGKNDLE